MQSSSTRDLAVGVFVLLGLAAIAYLSLQVGGIRLRRDTGLVVFATFDDVGGLSARAPVRISGVKVGRVEEIELDDDLRARVRIELEQGLQLSADTSAAIRTAGLLGDQFIALEPGAEDALLGSGEEFSFTESAFSLDKLVGRLVHGSDVKDGE